MSFKNKYDYKDLFHEIGKSKTVYDTGTPDKFFKREKYLFGLLGKKGEEITNGIIYRKNDLGLIDWELCYNNSLKEYEKTWYKNGKLCSESYYKDGILTERKEYYENGQLKNEKQPNGNKKYYHENGELDGEYLIIENKIINDQQVYYHKKYSENGVLMYEGELRGKSSKSFSGGIQIGLWKLYNEEGELKTNVTYDDFGETKKEEVVDDKNKNLSNEEIWLKRWIIRVSHITLSNGYKTEWFDFKECEIYECEDGDIEDGDILDDGSMYKGKIINYTEFLEIIEKDNLEVLESSEEDYHILNSLEEGKEKFNELIKNTWVES